MMTVFDCGPLKGNFAGAHAEMDELLAAIRSPETYDRQTKGINPLVETHNSVWFRVLEVNHVIPNSKGKVLTES